MSRYATHLPVLQFLMDNLRPDRILEFGIGEFSTPLLLSQGSELITVETDVEWLARMTQRNEKHTVVHWPNDCVADFLLDFRMQGFDLAFVDGPVDSRVTCVERLFWRARVIVIHDSMTRCYRWGRLIVPTQYKRIDYTALTPATSIFAFMDHDIERILAFCESANYVSPRNP